MSASPIDTTHWFVTWHDVKLPRKQTKVFQASAGKTFQDAVDYSVEINKRDGVHSVRLVLPYSK